jgi:hypothetical protein
MADTKKYKVVTPIGMHGKDYAPGKTIELTDAEAEAMPWAIEPAQKKEDLKPEANKN